jgi:hypothetical protein
MDDDEALSGAMGATGSQLQAEVHNNSKNTCHLSALNGGTTQFNAVA